MWSYYGSKSKLVHLYPEPQYPRIIEPFAGTARYALRYWDRDVTIIDKDDKIIAIWKWLQRCSPHDILKLPVLKQGENLDNFAFDCIEAKWLMGFLVTTGAAQPCKTATFRATTHRPNLMPYSINRIANSLHKIKHWNIICGSYQEAPDVEATWFVDPPYQVGGQHYQHSKIDYNDLLQWVYGRQGQTIVCENTKATWIDVQPLRAIKGSQGYSVEGIVTVDNRGKLW